MFDQVFSDASGHDSLLCPFIGFPHFEHFGAFLPRAAFFGFNNAWSWASYILKKSIYSQ